MSPTHTVDGHKGEVSLRTANPGKISMIGDYSRSSYRYDLQTRVSAKLSPRSDMYERDPSSRGRSEK